MKRAALAALVAWLLALAWPGDASADWSLAWAWAGPAAGARLDLPALDLPYNYRQGGSFPSMAQSLAVTTGLYEVVHAGLRRTTRLVDGGRWAWLGWVGLVGFDLVGSALPGLATWHHEEWHRAVMTRHGVASFDDVYRFQIFSSFINVSHVTDDDLIRLKRDSPPDMVRLSTAGIEGNYALVANLERQIFFEGTGAVHAVILPLLLAQNILYMRACSTGLANRETDDANAREGANVAVRDFTGLDCTGWTYDLFRPDEPYQARGIHPSGVGINRYRKLSDLTADEAHYLRVQTAMSLLNLIDPFIFTVGGLRWGPPGETPWVVNGAVRHVPTAFGYLVRLDGFVARGERRALLSLSAFANHERVLPGASAELVRWPAAGQGTLAALRLSLRLDGWLQPEGQRFFSRGVTPGGLVAARAGWCSRSLWRSRSLSIEPWLEVEAKSEGWVEGNVYLVRSLAARAGAVVRWDYAPPVAQR